MEPGGHGLIERAIPLHGGRLRNRGGVGEAAELVKRPLEHAREFGCRLDLQAGLLLPFQPRDHHGVDTSTLGSPASGVALPLPQPPQPLPQRGYIDQGGAALGGGALPSF